MEKCWYTDYFLSQNRKLKDTEGTLLITGSFSPMNGMASCLSESVIDLIIADSSP